MNRVGDFGIGDILFYNNEYYRVDSFPTRYSLLLKQLGTVDNEITVPVSKLLKIKGPKSGVRQITEERYRQIEKEGFLPENDDQYTGFQLSRAAACLAKEARNVHEVIRTNVPIDWPWDESWWKPMANHDHQIMTKKDAIDMLKRAGALIAAEIDRLNRKED